MRSGFRILSIALVLACLCLPAPAVRAQEAPVPTVAGTPTSNPLGPDQAVPLVVELFSSQACVFCPRADRLFADLAKQDQIIGLACHVDYFDVNEGSLARTFCTARQTWYAETLRLGPNYTPQIVVQGLHDTVGYKLADVTEALQKAAAGKTVRLAIEPAGKAGEFVARLPAEAELTGEAMHVWLALYDKPHELTVAEGRNKGQKMTYVNIVSDLTDLGVWDGADILVPVTARPGAAGFALLVQDMATGRIAAAGQYVFPQPAQ